MKKPEIYRSGQFVVVCEDRLGPYSAEIVFDTSRLMPHHWKSKSSKAGIAKIKNFHKWLGQAIKWLEVQK